MDTLVQACIHMIGQNRAMVDLLKAIYLIPMPRLGLSSPDEFLA